MKFLVENYASEYNTQALYLAKGLNEKEEHTCVLWNNSCSLYFRKSVFCNDVS